jgi:hypothetical protein
MMDIGESYYKSPPGLIREEYSPLLVIYSNQREEKASLVIEAQPERSGKIPVPLNICTKWWWIKAGKNPNTQRLICMMLKIIYFLYKLHILQVTYKLGNGMLFTGK